MRVAKKVLYILSGVIKCVVGGFALLICLLMLLLQSVLRGVLESSPDILNEMIKGLTESEDMDFLLGYTQSEQLDYVFGIITKFALIVGLICAVWIVLAVFLFILAKRISDDDFCKKTSIVLTVASWIVSMFTISTILTTIATCLRRRKSKEKYQEIEAYQE